MRELAEAAPGVLVASAVLYTTTSTVVIGPGGSCLVVDPAVTAGELAALAGELASRRLRPQAGWATHPHWDHILWSRELGDVPRYATPRAAAAAARDRRALTAEVAASAPGHDLESVGRLTPLAGSRIPWNGPTALVIEHDAHEFGHGAVLLPETGTLLAGDMLSDIEIPLLAAPEDHRSIGRYRAGLELLASLDGVQTVVPGHGRVGDRAEFHRRVEADRHYLDLLECGDPAASEDERIGTGWLRAEHERQFSLIPR